MISVFTPTYNRARLLPRLYESLCQQQTHKEYEWLIVDDGSTDNTKVVVDGFISEDKINIRYFWQENGGKHRAINRGLQEAQGELFFIVDSDDWLPENVLQMVAERWEAIKGNQRIGGICGLDITPDGKVIGSGLPCDELICNSIDIRLKHHVTGDLKEVFCTSVLRELPFPEYVGEKFCPEALAWNRIAQQFDLLFINQPIYIADYQPGGLTDRIVRVRMQSPLASTTCYQEMLSYDIPLKEKIKAAINYWRFRLCSQSTHAMQRLPLLWNILMPIGWAMHLRDKSRG